MGLPQPRCRATPDGNLGHAFPGFGRCERERASTQSRAQDALAFGPAPGGCFCGSGVSSTAPAAGSIPRRKAQGRRVSGKRDAAAAVGLFNVYLDPDLAVQGHSHFYVKLDAGDEAPIRVDDEAGAFACNVAAGPRTMARGTLRPKRWLRLTAVRGRRLLASVARANTDASTWTTSSPVKALIGLRCTF
jgi:hypothetical protein